MTLDLACRLGMKEDFWNGDYNAMLNKLLKPPGITINEIRSII
jgi:hypothetical protein